jgi:deferrochelatase/peroxidase EfeB
MGDRTGRADETGARPGISRRALLGALGAGAAVAVTATAGAAVTVSRREDGDAHQYAFHGTHQAGVTTPMQTALHFAALDLVTESRAELVSLLRRWTQAAALLTTGAPVGTGAVGGSYDAPPDDTGDALDLPASGLTVTIGFGPGLFRSADGRDRFGLAAREPAHFGPLPHFPGDALDPAVSSGDLCIQACADDAQVAVHAVRTLVRLAFGTAVVRWSQMGYGRSSATEHDQPTPRNLFGFKDGTANVTGDESAALDSFVWSQPGDGPAWMDGGTYLAVRKIRMTIETWDRSTLRDQESVFGRTKREGAPLSGGGEFTPPDFSATGREGGPLIPVDSHVALAHPSANDGSRILRRAYNYTDGSDGMGRLDAGLFFLAFARNLEAQFVPMQMRLARSDRMNEYVRYVSSAAFAVPPGVNDAGGYVGASLLD